MATTCQVETIDGVENSWLRTPSQPAFLFAFNHIPKTGWHIKKSSTKGYLLDFAQGHWQMAACP